MSIEIKDVTYIYDQGTPSESTALSHVNLTIQKGEFVGIIGHTGSGKSTLIQHLNGLIRPTGGQVICDGEDIFAAPTGVKKKKELRALQAAKMKRVRQKVGLVFQYPEHQLFEMTVAGDIAFGPKNLGLGEEEIERRVDQAMAMVGLSDEYKEKSPFELFWAGRRGG